MIVFYGFRYRKNSTFDACSHIQKVVDQHSDCESVLDPLNIHPGHEYEVTYLGMKSKFASSVEPSPSEADASIGAAKMQKDGTIALQLRAEGPNGSTGDAVLRYPPGHPQYREILQHLCGLKKGHVRQVPPWSKN